MEPDNSLSPEKQRFANNWSELCEKAGIPPGYGRYAKLERLLNSPKSTYRNRCEFGLFPKVAAVLERDVLVLLKCIESLTGEIYDKDSIVEWLSKNDIDNPFDSEPKINTETVETVTRVIDSLLFAEGIDREELSADSIDELSSFFITLAKSVYEEDSDVKMYTQIVKHDAVMTLYRGEIKKFVKKLKSREDNKVVGIRD